jgi:undecaprenyl phosphate N,N'-diacetylbacillosamine 1-phosphate transferase
MRVHSFYARFGKRLFDLAVVIPLLFVIWPLLLAIAVAVRLTSRGPAFFRQGRLGKNAHVFEAWKFRTMTDKPRVPDTIAFSGDQSEITAIGRILRRTKLDELPQVFNVLQGEMSLVGPRPQLPIQLSEFDENASQRLLVRPGLTGMAQTHGGVELTWAERWYYDADYVHRLSFTLDLWLIVRTFGVLMHGEERYLVHPKLPSRPKND